MNAFQNGKIVQRCKNAFMNLVHKCPSLVRSQFRTVKWPRTERRRNGQSVQWRNCIAIWAMPKPAGKNRITPKANKIAGNEDLQIVNSENGYVNPWP